MPAAAVIPAPIAYIKVAAVKKLVVGSRVPVRVECSSGGRAHARTAGGSPILPICRVASRSGSATCQSASPLSLTGWWVRSVILP